VKPLLKFAFSHFLLQSLAMRLKALFRAEMQETAERDDAMPDKAERPITQVALH
jgi:hypothetical protein